MGRRIPLARARAPWTAHIAERETCDCFLEPVPDCAPGPHVLRLFLRPDDLLERRVGRDETSSRIDGERIELLETGDRDRGGLLPELVTGDVVIELAGGEDEPRHVLTSRRRVVEKRRKTALGQIGERGRRLLQAQ